MTFVTTKRSVGDGIVHLRVQQRNGRKSLTSVQGLAADLDRRKILRALKRTFNTNGTILKDKDGNKVLQLQGDLRHLIKEFLLKTHICEPHHIKVSQLLDSSDRCSLVCTRLLQLHGF